MPLSENSSSLGVSSWLQACSSVSDPSKAVGPRNNVPARPLLIAPKPVNQTLSCELNLIEALQLCLFLKHSHTVALICNVASHNSNKWTFIFNASTVASLSTQHYGAKPGPQLARKIFSPLAKMCWTYFKTQARNQGERGRSLPCKPFRPLGKICWA